MALVNRGNFGNFGNNVGDFFSGLVGQNSNKNEVAMKGTVTGAGIVGALGGGVLGGVLVNKISGGNKILTLAGALGSGILFSKVGTEVTKDYIGAMDHAEAQGGDFGKAFKENLLAINRQKYDGHQAVDDKTRKDEVEVEAEVEAD